MVDISKPLRPRPVDRDQMEKAMVKTYRDERLRRRRSVDDEFRDEISTKLPTGEFSLSNVSMHEVWQEEYLNKFGKFSQINGETCRHCGTKFLMGFPPEECPVCHTVTRFGELVRGRYFNK